MENIKKLFFFLAFLFLAGNVLAAVNAGLPITTYNVSNPKIQKTTNGTIISGNVNSNFNLLGSEFSLKIYSKDNQKGFINYYGGKIGTNGNFSILVPNILIPPNYNFLLLLGEKDVQPYSVNSVGKSEITNVFFSRLPRHASEGVYAGEEVTLSWITRNISEDSTVTILFYPIDENKKRGAPTIIDNNVLNTGEKTFIIPKGLLRTTEPDYKPYVVTVMYNKDRKVFKDISGHIYIKHNGCPVFSFGSQNYENENYIQKLKVVDWGEVAKGDIGVKIFATNNGIKERDPIEGDGKNRIKVTNKQSEIIIKTVSILKPSAGYYIYMTGNFWDKEGELVNSICVLKRGYIQTPQDLYEGQDPRIEVDLPKEAVKGSMPNMDKKGFITVKWKTYGIPPGGTVNIEVRTQESAGAIDRKLKTEGDIPLLYHKEMIPNTGTYRIERTGFQADPNNTRVAIHVYHSYSFGGNTGIKIHGRSPLFDIGNQPCPNIEILQIDPRYYGLNVTFKITDWKKASKISFYINNKRSNLGYDDFGDKQEFNDVERYDNEGKVNGYKDIGFNSTETVIDSVFSSQDKIYSLKYPAISSEQYYQLFKKFPEKIFYLAGKYPYYATIRAIPDNTGQECIAAGFFYLSLPRVTSPASVRDGNATIINPNTVSVLGTVLSQGYSVNGIAPYLEIANSKQDLEDQNSLIFWTNQDNPSLPTSVKQGENYVIEGSDTSFNFATNKAVYKMCANDNGDGFVDKYMEAYSKYQTETTGNKYANQWLLFRKTCNPMREIIYSLPSGRD